MKNFAKRIVEGALILGLIYGGYKGIQAYVRKVKNNIEESKTYYELELNKNQESNLERYIKIDENDPRIFVLEKVVAKKGDTIEQLLLNKGIDVYEKMEENRSEWYNLFTTLNGLQRNEHIIAGQTYLVPRILDSTEAHRIENLIKDRKAEWLKEYYH
ncbi:MAG: hypothetical protein ACP5OZ_00980 [Candidatus Woesearchaeota archaeon]